MARIFDCGSAPPQDLMFGFSLENIAGQLTQDNWHTKALLRQCSEQLLYIWIGYCVEKRTGESYYTVQVSDLNEQPSELGRTFLTLETALNYVNCEDGGDIAALTVTVPPDQYPRESSSPVTVFTVNRPSVS